MVKRNLFFFFFFFFFFCNWRNLFLPPYRIEHCRYYWNREFGFWTMGIFFCSYSFMWPIIENIGIRIPQTTLLQNFLLLFVNYYCRCWACLGGFESNMNTFDIIMIMLCMVIYMLINIIHSRSMYVCMSNTHMYAYICLWDSSHTCYTKTLVNSTFVKNLDGFIE